MSLVSAEVHFDQAKQSFETGQFEKASRDIAYAIQINPRAASYDVLLGRIYLETHKLESAIQAFSSASQKDPALAEAHYYAGIVYQRWSDDEEAYKSYTQARELEPANAQYLMAAAESLIALGEVEQARLLVDPQLDYFEHNAALRQLQGQIALLQGEPAKAAELYSQARLLNPDDNLLLEELMWAQFGAQMYGPCHESLKSLRTRIKVLRPDLEHLEARCLTLLDRGVEARELYLGLTKRRSSDVVLWSELGALAWNLGDYRRVAECSVQLIAQTPERHEGYMLRGINERHQGNSDQAIKSFRQAAQRAADIALPHMLLGQSLEDSGDFESARLAYNKAIYAEPANDQARDLLSRLNESQSLSAVTDP